MRFAKEFERAQKAHRQGKLREAFHRYDAIIKADPRHAQALHLSGVVLHQSGQHQAAAERMQASLRIDPSPADVWSNLALALEAAGWRDAAVEALQRALQREPRSAELASNLAALLIANGDFANAEAAALEATAADPQHPHGWYSLALALERQHRTLGALNAVSRAVALDPRQAEFSGLKAQLETMVAGPGRARTTLEAALARNPLSAALQFEYAGLLENAGEPEAAAQAYAQAVRLDPTHGAALSQLLFVKRWLADWRDVPSLEQKFRDGIAKGRAFLSPFVLLGQPSTRAEQRRCAQAWSAALAGAPSRTRRPLSAGRMRIGYLSADFHTHATAFLAAGLFEHHDRSRFDVAAYSIGPDDASAMRARLRRGFDRFVDLAGATADVIAARIRDDHVDLLIDLNGHTAGAPPRVLALRPAPMQAHYLGFPGTLGGGLVDWLIGDAVVTPAAEATDYSEALVRLPGSYQINDRERVIVGAPPRAALGLPYDAVVLCNFNATWKLRPEVFDAWTTILRRVPQAVLWLLARRDGDPALANLRREIDLRGVDPARLVFAAARPNAEYLGLYAHADLFLDTWPYNAHTTGSDALWAGCPVLTLRGETFASRVGESLSLAVGLPELVARTVDDYIASGVSLALDPDRRNHLRAHLAGPGRASALFDTERTTRALEAAYRAMAEQYRVGVRASIDL